MKTHRFAPLRRFVSLLLCFCLLCSLLVGCDSASAASQEEGESSVADLEEENGLQRYSTIFYDSFDTVTTVIAYCKDEAEFNRQTDALHADLNEYNDLYDIYNDYEGINNIKTVNDNAGIAPVKVDSRIIDLLELAKQMYTVTDGKTNVAMGAVLRLWHNCREAAEATESEADNLLPDPSALKDAARHCNIDDVIIDRKNSTVYLKDPLMSLDVGSIGKGYATEMVCRNAQKRGLTRASVSVGGNLRAIGKKPGNQEWTGGVASPWDAGEVYGSGTSLVSAVYTTDLALVTSGDYQRYYVVDGKKYHHIIDPDTLYPSTYFNSVTILCADSGQADALSTGLFCMPLEEGKKIIESLPDVEALWCEPDGTVTYSSGYLSHEMKQ